MADVGFTGIHHIKLPVSDLARSREWYERVLAYTVDREFPDDHRRLDPLPTSALAVIELDGPWRGAGRAPELLRAAGRPPTG